MICKFSEKRYEKKDGNEERQGLRGGQRLQGADHAVRIEFAVHPEALRVKCGTVNGFLTLFFRELGDFCLPVLCDLKLQKIGFLSFSLQFLEPPESDQLIRDGDLIFRRIVWLQRDGHTSRTAQKKNGQRQTPKKFHSHASSVEFPSMLGFVKPLL